MDGWTDRQMDGYIYVRRVGQTNMIVEICSGLDVKIIICILLAGQCLDDTFSVTGSFKTYVPVICGDNAGQHSTYNLKLKQLCKVVAGQLKKCFWIFHRFCFSDRLCH